MAVIAAPDGYIVVTCEICSGSGTAPTPVSHWDVWAECWYDVDECGECSGAGSVPVDVTGQEEAT